MLERASQQAFAAELRCGRRLSLLSSFGQRQDLSATVAEALAAAQTFGGTIAVSSQDVGPNLKAAAEHDRVPFTIL